MADFDTVALPALRGLDRFAAGLTRGFMQRGEIEAARRERRRQEERAAALRAADIARRQQAQFGQLVEGLSQNLLGRRKGTTAAGTRGQSFKLEDLKKLRAQLQAETPDSPVSFTEARQALMLSRPPAAPAAAPQVDPRAQLARRQAIMASPEFETFARNLAAARGISEEDIVNPFFDRMAPAPVDVQRPPADLRHLFAPGQTGLQQQNLAGALASIGNDAADIPAAAPVVGTPTEQLDEALGQDRLATREAADELFKAEKTTAPAAKGFGDRKRRAQLASQLQDNFFGQQLETNVVQSISNLHKLAPEQLATELPKVMNQAEADLKAMLGGIRPKNTPVPRDLREHLEQERWRAKMMPDIMGLGADDKLFAIEDIKDPQERLLAYEQSVFNRLQKLGKLARAHQRTTPLENIKTANPATVRDKVFTEQERTALGLPADDTGDRRLTGEEFAVLGLKTPPAFTRTPEGGGRGGALGEGEGLAKLKGAAPGMTQLILQLPGQVREKVLSPGFAPPIAGF